MSQTVLTLLLLLFGAGIAAFLLLEEGTQRFEPRVSRIGGIIFLLFTVAGPLASEYLNLSYYSFVSQFLFFQTAISIWGTTMIFVLTGIVVTQTSNSWNMGDRSQTLGRIGFIAASILGGYLLIVSLFPIADIVKSLTEGPSYHTGIITSKTAPYTRGMSYYMTVDHASYSISGSYYYSITEGEQIQFSSADRLSRAFSIDNIAITPIGLLFTTMNFMVLGLTILTAIIGLGKTVSSLVRDWSEGYKF
jgi:hypothetical protein